MGAIETRYFDAAGSANTDETLRLARARAELGYEPHIAFEEGLRRTIDWYRQQS